MCKLLISVRSVEEALLAQNNGADFIDLKDPKHGALGALDIAESAAVLAALDKGSVVSATIGDLPMESEMIDAALARRIALGIDYLKVGFFPATMQAYESCLNVIRHYTEQGYKIIVVLFADHTYPYDLMPALQQSDIAGVMLDTASKNGNTLLDYYSDSQLSDFVNEMKVNERLIGLAGSIHLEHVNQLKPLQPDYLGFRGGVCDAGVRSEALNPTRIRELSKVL